MLGVESIVNLVWLMLEVSRMKIPKNYKDIIREAISDDWHCLGKRSEGHILPIYEKLIKLKTPEAQEMCKVIIEFRCFWKNSFMEFYVSKERFIVALESITRILFNYEKATKHIQKVLDLSYQAKDFAKFFKDNDLSKLSNAELFEKYRQTVGFYTDSFMQGFVSWGGQVIQSEAQRILGEKKSKLNRLGIDEKEAFGILAKSIQTTGYFEKEEALDLLAQKHGHFNEVNFELEKDINGFLEKHGWVGYDYGGPVMSFQEVIDSLKDRKLAVEEGISKGEIFDACDFSEDERRIFEILQLLSLIKDERNLCDDFVHYCLDFFFIEIGKRYNLTRDEVRALWPEELEALLLNKQIYTKKYINKKREFCLGDTSSEGICDYYIGEKAKEIYREVLDSFEKKKENIEGDDENIIKGTIASSGIVKGNVRIIHNLDDVAKMQQDEILVTHMTSPRFMMAIRKAKGIITDDGGLTSHAAIISREFKIPCIVGTKNATQILKDGDEVEVDANNGIVRVICNGDKSNVKDNCKEVNINKMKIDKNKTALLILDFVNDLLSEEGRLASFGIAAHAKQRNVISNTKKLLEKARSEGLKVIYSKVEYREGYPEIRNSKAPIQLGLPQTGALVKGSYGSEICNELKPLPGEVVISKSRINPFTNSEFEKQLEGIETIILAGVATNFVVESLARTASDLDYNVIIAEDCCASMNQEMHDFSINCILPNLGSVVSSEEIYSAL